MNDKDLAILAGNYTVEQLQAAIEHKKKNKEAKLTADVIEKINELLIYMKDIPSPEIDPEYDPDGSIDCGPGLYSNFKNSYDLTHIQFIKAVLENILKEPNYKVERMARAYYTSFCNG